MGSKYSLILCVGSFLLASVTPLHAKEFTSTSKATEIIELFTSEGCSSCPPADKWLRQLKADPGLFKRFIPMAFHVDYWDRLGWTDRFASQAYTSRQYRHKTVGNINQVYTPGFVVNNKEWRGWFKSNDRWSETQQEVGVLKVDYQEKFSLLNVLFEPVITMTGDRLLVNVAILGMNLTTAVKTGENGGRHLQHDFVVLKLSQEEVALADTSIQKWQVAMPSLSTSDQNQRALVVWLSDPESQKIIQAVGGYL